MNVVEILSWFVLWGPTFCPQVLDVGTMPPFMMHVGGGADVGMVN